MMVHSTNGHGGVHVPTLLELESTDPNAEHFAYLGPVRDRRVARDWGLVLASQGIAHALVFALEGWVVQVPRERHAEATRAVRLYQDENRDWPPVEKRDVPRHRLTYAVGIAFALVWLFFAGITGPVIRGSDWFVNGRADAHLLFAEPWRMVTALTLHADSQHVIGNAISGTIFGTAVSRRIGPGGALFAVASAGALGNAANALAHLPRGHFSIGASTAVFGAIGLLAGFQTLVMFARRNEPKRKKLRAIDFAGPLAGGLALLGSLGAGGESTDLGAHGFGFVAGVSVGLLVAFVMQKRGEHARPSTWLQVSLGAATVLLFGGSWALAMVR
jgi:rhomboid protease GluP